MPSIVGVKQQWYLSLQKITRSLIFVTTWDRPEWPVHFGQRIRHPFEEFIETAK